MGGTMWVESDAGRGADFVFTIQVPVSAASAPAARPELAGRRVLVIDDNATSRAVLARHVRALGAEPWCAANAAEADATLAAGERFDAALVDYHMPDIDGLAWARQFAGDRKKFPILLLNALGETLTEPGAIDGAVHKPLKRELLGERLATALGAARRGGTRSPVTVSDLRQTAAARPLRILMAEDNAVNQTVARHQLARLGYQATVVGNGELAAAAVAEGDFDVVLMDVQMPDLDGFGATRRIRAEARTKKLPWIIALTAGVGSADREEARAAGMNDYVAKPLRPEALQAALAQAYERVRALRAE
jgi:CheY-like chemotaxis protein